MSAPVPRVPQKTGVPPITSGEDSTIFIAKGACSLGCGQQFAHIILPAGTFEMLTRWHS
jgi:hypothetical protein